jgi:hypothetical protein
MRKMKSRRKKHMMATMMMETTEILPMKTKVATMDNMKMRLTKMKMRNQMRRNDVGFFDSDKRKNAVDRKRRPNVRFSWFL